MVKRSGFKMTLGISYIAPVKRMLLCIFCVHSWENWLWHHRTESAKYISLQIDVTQIEILTFKCFFFINTEVRKGNPIFYNQAIDMLIDYSITDTNIKLAIMQICFMIGKLPPGHSGTKLHYHKPPSLDTLWLNPMRSLDHLFRHQKEVSFPTYCNIEL